MKKVQVLLSTYNGEKYLREQLDSIISQDYVDIEVLIRDDGSMDGTLDIIKLYASMDSRITYYSGNNIGARDSFFDLIRHADMNADYYAFADQDDVWLKDKLRKAVYSLDHYRAEKGIDIPLLYCSNVSLVDENLKVIRNLIYEHQIVPAFGNALIENVCIGCTIVINKKLLTLAQNHLSKHAYMHDWWLYMIASCFGKVIFDKSPNVLYRQHSMNTIGAPTNMFYKYLRRLKTSSNKMEIIRCQAMDFKALFEPDNQELMLLQYITDYRKNIRLRLKLAFSHRVFRQNKIDNIIFKLMFLFMNT